MFKTEKLINTITQELPQMGQNITKIQHSINKKVAVGRKSLINSIRKLDTSKEKDILDS